MPRKSAAHLSVIPVDGTPIRLQPPASLGDRERQVFTDTVAACEPGHFRNSDIPLLLRFCEACVLADRAAAELRRCAVIDGKPSPWLIVQEKCVRALTALSMRLRLSPQSRLDAKTVARHPPSRSPYFEDTE